MQQGYSYINSNTKSTPNSAGNGHTMATTYTFTDQDRDTCNAVMRAANAGTLTPNTVRVIETEGAGAGTTGLLDGRTRSMRGGMIRYAMVADHDGSIRWVSWFKVVA